MSEPIGTNRFVAPLRVLLIAASFSTALTAAWLLYAVTFILPTVSPSSISLWSAVAVSFLAYSALSLAYALTGSRSLWLRIPLIILSVAAIGFGVHSSARMIADSKAGGHVEGYIFLMAVLVGGHGLVAILYTAGVPHFMRD